eukprot:gene12008-13922_t
MDGFAGVVGYRSIRFVQSLLKPAAPKIDLQSIQASKTRAYKKIERLMENATEDEKYRLAAKAAVLRQFVYDFIGDGDKGHKKKIEDLLRFVAKGSKKTATRT